MQIVLPEQGIPWHLHWLCATPGNLFSVILSLSTGPAAVLCRGEWLMNDHVEEVSFYLWSFSNVYLEELTAIGPQQKSEIHTPAPNAWVLQHPCIWTSPSTLQVLACSGCPRIFFMNGVCSPWRALSSFVPRPGSKTGLPFFPLSILPHSMRREALHKMTSQIHINPIRGPLIMLIMGTTLLENFVHFVCHVC